MSRRFHVYRYQILPISRDQMSLFDEPISVDDLVNRKNSLFVDALLEVESFRHSRGEIAHRILGVADDIIVMRIGVNRTITLETRDFTEEEMENWPNSLVIFNNKPDIQKVAVEVEYKAFQNTRTAISIIEDGINLQLDRYLLRAHFNPIFDKSAFWDVVEKYPQRITEATFKMVSPNMSNISESLKLDLAGWSRNTNTQETTIQLQSSPNNHLTFVEGEEPVTSLVNYSAEGGGNAKMKVRGLNKRISTEDQVTEITIDEIEISLDSEVMLKQFARWFQELLTP